MTDDALTRALGDSVIETLYQPIVRIADRAVVGVEALARLNRPGRGTLSPDSFVPQVEHAGLGGHLTERVLLSVAAEVVAHGGAWPALSISLNFPLDVLLSADAIERVERFRASAGIAPSRIVLELTESRPVDDVSGLGAVIERLRAKGYGVALDDLALDTLNAERLMELPFSAVKLDKSVVTASAADPEHDAFLLAAIASGARRHLILVAEGVEDVATWRRLKNLGIHQAQGFLVSRPIEASDVAAWIASWSAQPPFA